MYCESSQVGASKSSLDLDDLANDEDDGTCKVCFDDPATIVILGNPCCAVGWAHNTKVSLYLI